MNPVRPNVLIALLAGALLTGLFGYWLIERIEAISPVRFSRCWWASGSEASSRWLECWPKTRLLRRCLPTYTND